MRDAGEDLDGTDSHLDTNAETIQTNTWTTEEPSESGSPTAGSSNSPFRVRTGIRRVTEGDPDRYLHRILH